MNIVVAPDSFKGSMTSGEACNAIKAGLLSYDADFSVTLAPIADGGEGTVDALVTIMKGETISEKVFDPLDREIEANYGWVEGTSTAIIETAAASGLPRLKEGELNPAEASTYGTGQLIRAAVRKGARRIILGLGGSATVDAGTGCFQALGVRFLDKKDKELKMNGASLAKVARIQTDEMDETLQHIEWVIASDVSNTLLGKEGAVYVFGPQKGVKNGELEEYEFGMRNYAEKMRSHTGDDLISIEGSGAAGGFGFTLYSLLEKVELRSGFDLVAGAAKLEELVDGADLVITGEGKMDNQTLYGKGPVGISRLARKASVPCIAFTGKYEPEAFEGGNGCMMGVVPIVDEPMTLEDAMKSGKELLQRATLRCMEIYHLKN